MTPYESKLAQFFVEREGEGILDVIRDVDFFEEGFLDSLDMVSLASYINQNFNKKLDLSDPKIFKAIRKFNTLSALINPGFPK